MKKFLMKTDHVIERMQTYFCCVILFMVMWLVFFMVFFRYALNNSIVWGEEMLRYLCMWAILVGSGLTIREDSHVCIDILQSIFKNVKIKMVLYVLTRLIAAVFIISLIPASMDLIEKSAGGHSASLTWLPISAVYYAYPIGAISMVLSYLSQVPRKLFEMKEGGLR
jgi:TRAP-type C4-dicarboxylate transport system permease small subunit